LKRKSDLLHLARFGSWLLMALVISLSFALSGCSIGPLDFGGGTPVPTGTPAPPTNTVPPPTETPVPRALDGSVVDLFTNKPIEGALVTAGGVLTGTNSEGGYHFDDVPANTPISFTASGYNSLQMGTGTSNRLDATLRPNTVGGRVTDATTGKALPGVLVKLVLPGVVVTGSASPTITNTVPVTGTTAPATTPTSSGMNFGPGLAAPAEVPTDSSAVASATDTGGPTQTLPADTSTPPPPTATPTAKPIPPTGNGFIAVYTDDSGNYFFNNVPVSATLTFKEAGFKLTKTPIDGAQKDVALEPFQVNAIYLTANWASSPDLLDGTLSWIAKSRINAVVVNVQDDASRWVFDTHNPEVLKANDTDEMLPDMPTLVQKLKSKGLYVIARVVTFQQKTMAQARPDWAVLSSTSGKPWKGGAEGQQNWLDASNPAAQDYMIDMTKEVLALGFDEIQYDYVRFPSDPAPSETGDMVFSSMPMTDTGKVKALQQFLKKAHDVIEPTDAFMDIDVFGYSLWPDQNGVPLLASIGQVLPKLLDNTDYASPMIYPSHFSPGEQGCAHPSQCAYTIIQKSGQYAAAMFAGRMAKYRPWLEAFDWPDADYTSSGSPLIPDQLRACAETNCWGWMMWDASNEYALRTPYSKP
jgi:hypothetical protein